MTNTTQISKTIEIKNKQGSGIAELSLPGGWRPGKAPDSPLYHTISRFFTHPDYQACGFTVREPAKRTYEGWPLADNHFLQLLSQPAHELSEDEFLRIHLLLEHVSWPSQFKMQKAQTRYIEPYNVLEIEGIWLEKGIKSKALFIDTTGMSGAFVRELWFIAPQAEFELFDAMVDSVFASLQWQQNSDEIYAEAS